MVGRNRGWFEARMFAFKIHPLNHPSSDHFEAVVPSGRASKEQVARIRALQADLQLLQAPCQRHVLKTGDFARQMFLTKEMLALANGRYRRMTSLASYG